VRSLSVLLAFLALAPAAAAQTPDGRVDPAELTEAGLGEHLAALQGIADANGDTRAAGTPGDRGTAEYVAGRLRAAGWRVRFQRFRMAFYEELSRPRLALGGRRFRPGRDFAPVFFGARGEATAPLRRAGRGCTGRAYRRVRRGDVALAGEHGCPLDRKERLARRAGAAALIVVARRGGRLFQSFDTPGARIPAVTVRHPVGRALSRAAPRRVTVAVDAVSGIATTRNVIADTRGPRRGRVVMAGGHLDSVHAGPGLNDNGSGIAALLELAEALGGRGPGAPVRLGFWAGEEAGLWGSYRYVDSLERPQLRRIRAYLNLDMVGSPSPKRAVYGTPRIRRMLARLVGPRAVRERDIAGRSDHAAFQDAGVPFGGLHTGAGRPWDRCYHERCDTIGNVDLPVLLEMTRVTGAAIERLAR
jgi:peptidase M28-like protein/PA domain-containing protein